MELSLGSVLNAVYIASFAAFFVYGQRIQTFFMLIDVRRKLRQLELFKNSARSRLLNLVQGYSPNRTDAANMLDMLTESFMIAPENLDPAGIVGKLQHVLDTYDDHLKAEVRRLAPAATEIEANNLANLLEVSIDLDTMFRVVRHYYLQSKKQGGMLALTQLQMGLPSIMEEAEAYNAAVDAFAQGKPVGDGIGPLIATHFAQGSKPIELVKDTNVYESIIEGRRLLIVRAKGPGGNVGKPGLAVEKLIQERAPLKAIITVDAALKLEGEPTGEIAEGVGAAIGGPGVERYQIEEAATKSQIPLYAVVVKMSSKEAISEMSTQIKTVAEEAEERVRVAILRDTMPGDTVVLAGIGNTIGIE
jgi:hypothetical protein